MRQLLPDSLIDKFLDRYQRPDDVISFEIRALATVEIEYAVGYVRRECQEQGADIDRMEAMLAPVTQFLKHPEVELTRSRLEYLITVIKTCKAACSSDA